MGKDFHVSPFFDVNGTYGLWFTLTPDRASTAVTLHREGARRVLGDLPGPRRHPPGPGPATQPPAPMTQRVSALIRMHGIWLWLRGLSVRASPTPHPPGQADDDRDRLSSTVRWPALAASPRAPIRAVVARLDLQPLPRYLSAPPTPTAGRSEEDRLHHPEFEVVRPAAFFARLGRDAKIGLR